VQTIFRAGGCSNVFFFLQIRNIRLHVIIVVPLLIGAVVEVSSASERADSCSTSLPLRFAAKHVMQRNATHASVLTNV